MNKWSKLHLTFFCILFLCGLSLAESFIITPKKKNKSIGDRTVYSLFAQTTRGIARIMCLLGKLQELILDDSLDLIEGSQETKLVREKKTERQEYCHRLGSLIEQLDRLGNTLQNQISYEQSLRIKK